MVGSETVDPNWIIWRYMRFDFFKSILERQALHFSRPCNFEDTWDGHYPPAYLRRIKADAGFIPEDEEALNRRFMKRRYGFFVSCWKRSDYECMARWDSCDPESVAIQSTVGDAQYCLAGVHAEKVIYYDPADDVRHESIIGPDDILYKKREYEYEQELRMWTHDSAVIQAMEDGYPNVDLKSLSPGYFHHLSDSDRFFHKVVISPHAKPEFIEAVNAFCVSRKRHWLSKRIEPSRLTLPPSAYC